MSELGAPLPETIDDALRTALQDILREGIPLQDERTGDTHLELFSYQTGMARPQARILGNTIRRLDVIGAVGRFVWMVRGDDALAPVAHYVPRAAGYSPDGLHVPGSSYGARIRRPQPGVDQLAGVIERLRAEPSSRQAATVVWSPLDAVRDPFDIPCAFGTLYHCRDGGVTATTMMRSNKPSVMPVNFFEFSLLAELVAAELGLPLRRYLHYTGVLQVPGREMEAARAAVHADGKSFEMEPMPTTPSPLGQARLLAALEERIRLSRNRNDLSATMEEARADLHPYWYSFACVLSLQWHLDSGDPDRALSAAEELPEYFAVPAGATMTKRLGGRWNSADQ